MIEEPVGTWLCPSCSPNAVFYVKQLAQKRAVQPLVAKVKKTGESPGSRTKGQGKDEEIMTRKDMKEEVGTKGTAVKKPVQEKPKELWKGWIVMSSDTEEEFKKNVDAQWNTDTSIMGKRRTRSKVATQEDESHSRELKTRLRARGKVRIVETYSEDEQEQEQDREDVEDEEAESNESVYQDLKEDEGDDENNDIEKAAAPVRRNRPLVKTSSDDSQKSEDAMDVDGGSHEITEHSSDDLSDPSAESDGERRSSPELIQPHSISDRDDEDLASGLEAEELEDSMDMELHDENLESSSSSAISFGLQVSLSAAGREDTVGIDTLAAVAGLSQRQSNCWGRFPESKIRSTLPRLG